MEMTEESKVQAAADLADAVYFLHGHSTVSTENKFELLWIYTSNIRTNIPNSPLLMAASRWAVS